ncbi:helix-turn-helix domain-containing protein [Actinacidiphila sp. ITFR-21]|uniref:helix-turn-helix domain-containing protein n=1 Tax=Actinacidiphila sp. ITFR-21 TaxID=3075199 RepID=UPI00288A9BBD|nr:helix-turn-helix transcriptional regulator [Streptomyces sp. ITFR-21]WNI18093.1 helix-turn-helix transcriptional regulator [Streptomyces sp. ITFR-21]
MTVLLITPGWDDEDVRNPDGPPSSHIASGSWPNARLADDAPPGAHIAQALARELLKVMDERGLSARAVAELVGSTHPTIGRILDGSGVTDVRTVFLLEVALRTPLWPADLHRDFRLDVQSPGAGA